jgi:hypothetical protein
MNANAYSAQTNYSRLWYQQQNVTSPSQGQDAARIFEVFSGRDCRQTNSSTEAVYPVLGWTCQSSAGGDCYEAPYNIMSFQVGSAAMINAGSKKCWVASTGMAADRVGSGSAATAVGFMAVLLAGMLSWRLCSRALGPLMSMIQVMRSLSFQCQARFNV